MHSPFWNPNTPVSIGMACNIYNDANALPGLLETASQFFDDIVFYHAGPQGKYSDDGTIEIIEKWGAKIVFGKIDDGFGIVRTAAVRACPTEWVMILDADERFWPHAPMVVPHGDGGSCTAERGEGCYNQGQNLRNIIKRTDIDAIKTIRRHWHDMSWSRPCQNWHHIQDLQLRLVRNIDPIRYKPEVRMHEHIVDARTGHEPSAANPDLYYGIFHDHYHCFFKPMEKEQRAHDVRIYDAIHEARIPPTE